MYVLVVDLLAKLLELGAMASVTLGRRGETFVHAHVYEILREQGVCEQGRHFMCEGASLDEVVTRAHTAIVT